MVGGMRTRWMRRTMTLTPKIDQSKFGEHTIECIHIGFAEEKKAYLLYSRECRKIFESHNVEFEEIEGHECVTINSDSDDEGVVDPHNTRNGDPEGGHTGDAPSTPIEEMDHQEVQKTTPGTQAHPSGTQPLRHSTHMNKGVPPMRPDKDPKLTQGSRSSVKKTETPVTQDQVSSLVGTNRDKNQDREPLLHIIDNDIRALYLAADTPQTY